MTRAELECLAAGYDLPDFRSIFDLPAWMADAACREPHPDVTFFPARGEDVRPARAVCAGCLVAPECLDYALAMGERSGIWGGLSERERRRLRHDRAA